jgi:hypothetical protein
VDLIDFTRVSFQSTIIFKASGTAGAQKSQPIVFSKRYKRLSHARPLA